VLEKQNEYEQRGSEETAPAGRSADEVREGDQRSLGHQKGEGRREDTEIVVAPEEPAAQAGGASDPTGDGEGCEDPCRDEQQLAEPLHEVAARLRRREVEGDADEPEELAGLVHRRRDAERCGASYERPDGEHAEEDQKPLRGGQPIEAQEASDRCRREQHEEDIGRLDADGSEVDRGLDQVGLVEQQEREDESSPDVGTSDGSFEYRERHGARDRQHRETADAHRVPDVCRPTDTLGATSLSGREGTGLRSIPQTITVRCTAPHRSPTRRVTSASVVVVFTATPSRGASW
jgi:hypothetical protein